MVVANRNVGPAVNMSANGARMIRYSIGAWISPVMEKWLLVAIHAN